MTRGRNFLLDQELDDMKIKLAIWLSVFILITLINFIFVKQAFAITAPVGQWEFNESEGTTAVNTGTTGSAINANLAGGAIFSTGKQEGSIYTDGGATGTYATIPDNAAIDFDYNQNFTISFWIKDGSGNINCDAIVEKWDNNGAAVGYSFAFRWSTSGKMFFLRYDNAATRHNPGVLSQSSINDGNWHYVAAVKSGSNLYLYIDGNLESSSTDTTVSTTTNSYPVYIGKRGGTETCNWQGNLDSLRIYNYALTESQIYNDDYSNCLFPMTGNAAISGSCGGVASIADIDGVDDGIDNNHNTAVLGVAANSTLTIGPGKIIGFGSLDLSAAGGTIFLAEQNGDKASLQKGHIWVNDADGDGYAASNPPVRVISQTKPPNTNLRTVLSGATDQIPFATGGNVTQNGSSRIHTFTSVGSDSLVFTDGGSVQYLIVAGGGGGGGSGSTTQSGGGGGAGGVLSNSSYVVSSGSKTVVVGGGGNGEPSCQNSGASYNGSPGGNSSFNSIVATGGAGGGCGGAGWGLNGGSGGGDGRNATGNTYRQGIAGQGSNGGTGYTGTLGTSGAGGGGGAGGVGGNGSSTIGGAGGIGVSNSISGSSLFYGGGGGGARYSGSGGAGGSSIGGDGASNGAAGGNATANRGGGGGGAAGGTYSSTYSGGNGGSGIVIVSYVPKPKSSDYVPPAVAQVGATMGTFSTTSQTQLPVTRRYPQVENLNTWVYLLGGYNDSATWYDTVYKSTIDGSGNIGAWTSLAQTLPTASGYAGRGLGTSVIATGINGSNNYIYYIGGTNPNNTARTDVFYSQIDSSGNLVGWNTTTSLPVNTKQAGKFPGSVFITIDSTHHYVYLIGGGGWTAAGDSNAYANVYRSQITEATGALGTWTAVNSLPAARYAAATTTYKSVGGTNYIYVISGVDVNGNGTNTVYIGTVASDGSVTWTTSGTTYNTCSRVGAKVIGTNIFTFGQYAQTTTVKKAPITDATGAVGAFSTTGTSQLAETNYNIDPIYYNNSVYVIGGSGTNSRQDVYRSIMSGGGASSNIDCQDSNASVYPGVGC
jgi:hypothetical protein